MISSKFILGYAGDVRSDGEGEWYDTFIGGQAVWPEGLKVSIPPCPLCGEQRVLVMQAFAPHSAHSEREVYLFGCNSIRCASDEKSWFAARVCKEEGRNIRNDSDYMPDCNESRAHAHYTECDEREIDWDTDSDSDDTTASDLVADLAALSLKLQQSREDHGTSGDTSESGCNRIAKNVRPSHLSSLEHTVSRAQPERTLKQCEGQHKRYLKSHYVEVGEEPEKTNSVVDDDVVGRLLNKYEKEENTLAASGVTETWGSEAEERDSAVSENFEVFQDRISRAPEQILRYRFDSKPIWPKYPPPRIESGSNCECGSPLVFEVQVLGSCLHYLQPDKSVKPQRKEAGMNFAAAAVYTCRKDCTSPEILAHSPLFKMFRQAVVVQQDEW